MKLLKKAMRRQKWDLAAHIIVLATAKVLNQGVSDGGKTKKKTGRTKRQ